MKKKIVLVNQHTAYLFIDIVNAFAKQYDEVVLMAGVVHPLSNEMDAKVKVQQIAKYNLSSTATRILSWILGFIQVYWYLLTKYRNHEIFLYSNPPILAFLSLLIRRNASHLIVDVYPDALVSSGILKSERAFIYQIWGMLNRLALKKFRSVSTITQAMARKIEQYISSERIEVVNLWVDQKIGNVSIERSNNEFFTKYNLDASNFYVVYSGNLGKGHDVELLLDVAKAMKNDSNVFFIIAGEGYKKQLIRSRIEEEALQNCLWLPYQEKHMFQHLMAGTDIGVVTIDEPNAYVSIPSKTFNLMGTSKPIISFGKRNSELGKLIVDNKVGVIFDPDDIEGCPAFIRLLRNDQKLYQSYADNAKAASKNYTSANAEKFVKMHVGN